MKNRNWIYRLSLICLTVMMSACSVTKKIPAGEVLYTGVDKMEVINHDKSPAGQLAQEEIEAALSYAPNGAILGSNSLKWPIPLGLWFYTGFEKYKDKKGFGRWTFDKLGKFPVLISTVNPETRVKVASNLLHDYGFFRGTIGYTIVPQKNPQKAKIRYRVEMGKPYLLDSISYLQFPSPADSLILGSVDESALKKEDHFNVLKLEEERQRISKLLRNHGYFYYRPDFTVYRADTLQRSGYVSLQVVPKKGIPEQAIKTYRIGHTSIYLNGYHGETPTDSMKLPKMTLYYSGKRPGIRAKALRPNIYYKKGQLYNQNLQSYTQEAFARMGVFKYAEFRYDPRFRNGQETDTLDVNVYTAFDLPYDAELEFNVKHKSSDQTGPGAMFRLTRKNFMRLGANLSLQLKGSYEWQTSGTVEGESSVMNSYELGVSLSLDFPRLILPWKDKKLMRSHLPQHTAFKVYASQLNRARFFKMLSFGGSATYSYQPTRTQKHTITPFQLTFNTLQHTTARFDSIMVVNPNLALSLGNQFIPAMSYTYSYDNSSLHKPYQLWWETTLTSAGNITSLVYSAFGKGFKDKNKELLNSPYAQFVKVTTEGRVLFKIGNKSQLAARLMGGVICSYGNQTIAPYSEQFYIGGANSVRAFTVRSLGPGRFHPNADDAYGYVDQTGDIKFEANLEYRFPIFGDLYGAAFLDAGNVWSLRKDETRPDSQLKLKDLGKSIALGTGLGVRYDFTFLVIRLDLGVALHAPYDTGKHGYYNIPKFKDGLGLHFAIGYPF